MLPLFMMVTRTADEAGNPCLPAWYSLRSYRLVDGTVNVESQETSLNQRLAEHVQQSLIHSRALGEAEKSADDEPVGGLTPPNVNAESCSNKSMANSPGGSCLEGPTKGRLDDFESLPTSEECRMKQHRPKNRLGLKQRSKRRHHLTLRKPGRDSQTVKRAKPGASEFLKQFMKQSHVKTALLELRKQKRADDQLALPGQQVADWSKQIETVENDSALEGSSDETPSADAISAKLPCRWPNGVRRIYKQKNPSKISFADTGNLGMCKCRGDCYIDECLNSQSDVYCTPRNCGVGGRCNNFIGVGLCLDIFEAPSKGIGVYTSEAIEVGTIVGEYCGVLERYEGKHTNKEVLVTLKHISGYSLQLNQWATNGHFVFIEPLLQGSITRFINHSCATNCKFRKMRYRNRVSVVVVAKPAWGRWNKVTVGYSGKLWFGCVCKSKHCVGEMQKEEGYQTKNNA